MSAALKCSPRQAALGSYMGAGMELVSSHLLCEVGMVDVALHIHRLWSPAQTERTERHSAILVHMRPLLTNANSTVVKNMPILADFKWILFNPCNLPRYRLLDKLGALQRVA